MYVWSVFFFIAKYLGSGACPNLKICGEYIYEMLLLYCEKLLIMYQHIKQEFKKLHIFNIYFREIVYKHCRQLLLNLLIVLGRHNDHLGISRVMMTTKIDLMNFGLSLPTLPVIRHKFTEKNPTPQVATEDDNDSNQRDSESVSEDDENDRHKSRPFR